MSESIEEKFDTLSKAVTDLTLEIRTWRAQQAEICKSHSDVQSKLMKVVIDGNGTPSLVSQVQDLQSQMAVIKWIVGILAPAVVTLLGNAVWHWLKTG